MKATKQALVLTTLIVALPCSASAAEVNGGVTLASDYVFRGFSQTDEKAAVQGGITVDTDSGFYVGIWASSVNFGPDSNTSTELDYYAGWSGDIADRLTLDIVAIQFTYPGESSSNYQEYGVAATWMAATLGFIYSPKYLGDGGTDFYYPYLAYERDLPSGFGLSFHTGYSTTNRNDFFAPGKDSYTDWSVGLTKDLAGVDLALTYHDTNISAVDEADARLVFSIAKSW